MEKVRNQRYELKDAEQGDIFYFTTDRKKTLYTINDVKPFETKKQAGFWIRYGNCRTIYPKPGALHCEAHKADRQIIFLRNTNNNMGQNSPGPGEDLPGPG